MDNLILQQDVPVKSISEITNSGFCQKARRFNYRTTDTNMPKNYTRAVIIKQTIRAALWLEERNPKHIMEYLNARYEECLFQNFQQKRINLLWDFRRIMRYLQEETRKAIFPPKEIITIGTHPYSVKPDFCFVDNGHIELVIMKIGKPNVTKRGKKNAEIRDLMLYSLILYGRKMGYENITASLYFLRKSNDTQNWAECEQNFFGSNNVISMTQNGSTEQGKMDQDMSRYIAMLSSGIPEERMCESDCDTCPDHDLCKYMLPPMRIDNIKTAAARKVNLTPAQSYAIQYDHGIARINAGAGAGKTMVVAFHIKALLDKGVKPEEICCITFTNAGAKEMLHRAELYSGRSLENMKICTFNAFEYDIVKECWAQLGFPREPKVIDEVERYSIIADIINKNPIYSWTGNTFLNFTNTKGWQKGALQITAEIFSEVKKRKASGMPCTTDEVRKSIGAISDVNDITLYRLIELYDLYENRLKQLALVEFDDQEILAFKIIQSDPGYLQRRWPFRHIIVDEFQDTSEAQLNLIKLFRQMPTFESLLVIGDDSQAIFSFRGTSPEYIINFDQYMGEPVDDIYLLENHRSTPEVIEFANRINDMNVDKVAKQLIATRDHGKPVIVEGFYNKTDEYNYIVDQIKHHLDTGVPPEDIAVITYTKSELNQIADLLTKKNIPSLYAAPEQLLNNSRIRAILAFARVIHDQQDTKDALIVANAKIGGSIMDLPEGMIQERVDQVIEEAGMICMAPTLQLKKELFEKFIDSISFQDEAVEYFKDSLQFKEFDEIMQYCSDFCTYGENALFKRIDPYPGVVLVTAHSSKGLEWPIVFNSITHYDRKERKSRKEIEEMRRLLFVSATRARDELVITAQFYSTESQNGAPVFNMFLQDAFKAAEKQFNPNAVKYDQP